MLTEVKGALQIDFDSGGPEADVEGYCERTVYLSSGLCTADTTASCLFSNCYLCCVVNSISQAGFLFPVAGNLGGTN